MQTGISTCRTTASCSGTADEAKTTIVYGRNLLPTSITVGAGNGSLTSTTTMTYDDIGNVLTVDGPLAGSTDTSRLRYNKTRGVAGEVAPDPDDANAAKFPATRYSYNSRGQVYLTESGTVNGLTDSDWTAFTPVTNTLTEFDSYGRPKRQKFRSGSTDHQVVDTIYDTARRVQCTMVRMSPSNWATASSSCNPTQTTGSYGPDRVTYYTYNAAGQVTKVTAGYGTTVASDEETTTFTANGEIATRKDAENNFTTYQYDGHDRLIKTRFPVATKGANSSSTTDYEQVTYDAADNMLTLRTRRGEMIQYTYDNLNRLTFKDVPARSGLATTHTRDVSFSYDLFDNMTSARFDSASGEGILFTYDALGRQLTETQSLDGASRTLTSAYDAANNRTQLTFPDTVYVSYSHYSSGGFGIAYLNGSSPLFYMPRDPAGTLAALYRWKVSSGSWANAADYVYDSALRLSGLYNVLTSSSYNNGTTFTYNPAGQIATRTETNDFYAWPGHVNLTRSHTSNGLNQYSAVAGTNFSYDANGNLTSDGASNFVYDIENRLVWRGSGSGTTWAELRYDPLGRLYETYGSASLPGGATGYTRFLYDGSDLVAEYDPSGIMLRRYVHGPGAGDDPLVTFIGASVADSQRRYLYPDERGSIVATTDANGVVEAINSYDEYGIPDSTDISSRGRFRYTGQAWLPELGMYYYKARMYSPTLGRFMQIDPIGYGDGMNMYRYAANDPVNAIDPTGLNCEGNTDCTPVDGSQVDGRNSILVEAEKMGVPSILTFGAEVFLPVDAFDCAFVRECTTSEKIWATADLLPLAKPFTKGRKVVKALGRTCGCFEAGTLVATPDGLVPIETLEVGDLVLSQSEATSEIAPKPITDLIRPEPKPLYELSLRDASGEIETFHATDDHPWKVEGKGWVETIDLAEGDRIDTATGDNITLLSVLLTQRVELTFNLTVADWHTFLVGEDQAVVHNACPRSRINRGLAAAERRRYWKAQAARNPGRYSAANLQRMRNGKPPIGSDGKPMELHHVDGTHDGGVQPMTRTDHRGGQNYRANHPWLDE